MFYFVNFDHKIIVKCRWRSHGATSSAMVLWQSPDGGSGDKFPKEFKGFFFKLKKPSKLIYFECKFYANIL